jgi:hypothetical protein
MPTTPVATNFSETLDVKVNLSSKLTLNFILSVNKLPETVGFFFSKVTHLGIRTDTGLSQNFPAQGRANAMNILQ